jgi:beta-glucosidase
MYNPTEKWLRARFLPCIPLGDNRSCITACEKHITLSRRAACEGSVLLKNENGFLPLEKGKKVAIFGNAQIDYVKGGSGSGDVFVPYTRNIYDGLKMKGEKINVFDSLSLFYTDYVVNAYKNGGENGRLTEPEIPEELLRSARAFTDTAIITICRFSGEGYDKKNDSKDKYFDLEDGEKKMVADVLASFENVVVLLNVGAMINTSWFAKNDKVKSALLLWQGGLEGGLAAADMLVGDDAPSGKLVDTCAANFGDYPFSAEFHESDDYAKYTEDIFVGYRYFETIPGKKDAVIYPFGYGLTYTTFEYGPVVLSDSLITSSPHRLIASCEITNTGNRTATAVPQLYIRDLVGSLTRPVRELKGFERVTIPAGESRTVTFELTEEDLAYWHLAEGVTLGADGAYAHSAEPGDFHVWIAPNAAEGQPAKFVLR